MNSNNVLDPFSKLDQFKSTMSHYINQVTEVYNKLGSILAYINSAKSEINSINRIHFIESLEKLVEIFDDIITKKKLFTLSGHVRTCNLSKILCPFEIISQYIRPEASIHDALFIKIWENFVNKHYSPIKTYAEEPERLKKMKRLAKGNKRSKSEEEAKPSKRIPIMQVRKMVQPNTTKKVVHLD